MTIPNPSFENNTDVDPRFPAAWTVAVVSSAFDIADFGTNESGVDAFEKGWGGGTPIFTFNGTAAGFDTTKGTKAFEPFTKWEHVDSFVPEIGSAEAAVFNSVHAFENFEDGWFDPDAVFLTTMVDGVDDAAAFFLADDEAFDGFEDHWQGNESYATSFSGSTAVFHTHLSTSNQETFESSVKPHSFTIDIATDVLTTADVHSILGGENAFVALDPDATPANVIAQLPGGLQPTITYRAIVLTTTTLKLSLDGSTPVNITDQGAGVFVLKNDPAAWWTLFLDI